MRHTYVLNELGKFTIDKYIEKINNKELLLTYSNNDIDNSLFIESLLLNFPIPSLTLLFFKPMEIYKVIDGNKRLNIIRLFLNNEFKLEGLPILSHLNDCCYQDLEDNLKDKLLNRTINHIKIFPRNEKFDDSIIYFLNERY